MIAKCNAKDCKYNKVGICEKDEIEIDNVSAYDINSAECMNYDKE